MKPFLPSTDAIVTVRIQGGFLSCGRPLPPNPVARIRSTSDGGAVLASTQAIAFTQSPVWNEDLQFVVPSIHAKTSLQLEIVDAFSGSFLGAVNTLPFNVRWPQRSTKLHRLMLTPRSGNAGDLQLLRDASEDDFGHIELAWDVQLCPIGPGPEDLGSQQHSSLPLSCMLRAQWIGMVAAASPSSQTSLVAHLGSSTQPVTLHAETPLVALLRSESEASIRITCKHRTTMRDEDVGLAHFVVPVRIGETARELTWCLPITPLSSTGSMMMNDDNNSGNTASSSSSSSSSLGMIIISLRLSPATSETAGVPSNSSSAFPDRSPPNSGFGPYLAHNWEDQDHLARASERRWKKSVVNDAKPKPNHIRHLLDVMAGRAELHPAMAPHLREFFNAAPGADVADFSGPSELRTFAIALAFACDQLSAEEAVMFAMGIMCSPLAGGDRRLPSMNDAAAILEASLLPYTLDLSVKEVRRRCLDLFMNVSVAPEHGIDIIVFRKRFASNFGFWFVHGASQIAHRSPTQAISSVSALYNNTTSNNNNHQHNASVTSEASAAAAGGGHQNGSVAPPPPPGCEDTEWLRFIIRVAKTKMGFAVTAHRDDTFAHVSSMVESTVEIACARMKFTYKGDRVDPATTVGSLVPPGVLPQTEFVVSEMSDLMALVVVWRAREKKFDMRVAPHDKVLKLRAMIQQKTNIPLSRVQLSYCNQTMWDRHSLDHYKLCDGAIIEVDAE